MCIIYIIIIIGYEDKKCSVDPSDMACVAGHTDTLPAPVNLEFLEAVIEYMDENGLSMPRNVQEALLLYVELVHYFETVL